MLRAPFRRQRCEGRRRASTDALAGAPVGRISKIGVDDNSMKNAAAALSPGESGLLLFIRKMIEGNVAAELVGAGGGCHQDFFDHARVVALREIFASPLQSEAPAVQSA